MSVEGGALSLFGEEAPTRPGPDPETEAFNLLSEAIEEHDPAHVFVMLSGGNDSRATAEIAMRHPRVSGCVLIDTGIAIEEAHESVKEFCRERGYPLSIYRTSEDYEGIVLEHGFPGPAQHSMMYRRLKERAVRRLSREHRGWEGWQQGFPWINPRPRSWRRVMLVAGIRKEESERRKASLKVVPVSTDGGRVWVSPLFYWTRPERDAFLRARQVPRNPISDKICGTSGDCLCGAMSRNEVSEELEQLRTWYPGEAARIDRLQEQARAAGVWDRWGCAPPTPGRHDHPEQASMFLCIGCGVREERLEQMQDDSREAA